MTRAAETARRALSRAVVAALVVQGLLVVADVASSAGFLGSIYLVPVLVIALVETGERTALVAAVAVGLALLSGVWHGFSSAELYRTVVVAGGGALGALAAALRMRAVVARERIEMLALIAQIADGTQDVEIALRRLAGVLVPGSADLCEIVVFDAPGPRRVATAADGVDAANEEQLTARPQRLGADALERLTTGEGVLIRHAREARPRGDSIDADALALRALGMASVIYAPVRAAGETLAVLVAAVGPSGRRYDAVDLRFMRTVGSRAALAVQNARLLTELREAQQRMEAVVGSLADAVTIRERSGRLVYANDAALQSMNLVSVDDLRNREPRSLFDQYIVSDEQGRPLSMDDLPSVKLLAGEQPAPLLLRAVDRDAGDERWSMLKATPLYDAAGQLEAAVTVIEDVTASKRAALRSDFLARVSRVLAGSLDYEQTLRNVAELAVPEIADWCVVDIVDERGQRQRVITAHRDPGKVELAERLRQYDDSDTAPDGNLARVLATGETRLFREIPADLVEAAAIDAEHLRLLRALQLRSAVIVAMRGADRTVGAMTLVNAESRRAFHEEDVAFAEEMAARAAVAVENSRLYSERTRIAATLQHSLLPDALPDIPGWEVAALYRPASGETAVEVGGDFYDAFPTATGWIVLIGDVTGKGVEAAAMTALVRHGARFIAEYAPEPAEILDHIDRALRRQPTLSLCTALCLHIDGDRIRFASAGHPLPLLVSDDGVRTLGRAGAVLGAFEDGDWPATDCMVREDELLLLYTDGVTDTVGQRERFGETRLCDTMAECGPSPPQDLLACLDTALSRFQVGAQADDTAALALRLAGRPLVGAAPAGAGASSRRSR